MNYIICNKYFFIFYLICFVLITKLVGAQNDLPNPTANMQTIKTGALIIPMDNTMQSSGGFFNLRAYGLVNYLLQNNVPVMWAIRSGKSKDDIDFTASAQRIRPSVQFPNTFDFRCGPFIVDSLYANAANMLAGVYGNSVSVFKTTAPMTVDIRYSLNFKPKIAVCSNGGNQAIHLNILTAANMNDPAWVTVIPASQVVPLCGYTLVSEPHWDTTGDTTHTRPVYRYLKNGGNFFSQCKGVSTYENADTLHTTNGVAIRSGSTMAYFNSDLPIMQFDGVLTNPGGSLQYWDRNGGTFRPTTYTGIQTSSEPAYQFLNGAKVVSNAVAGGNMFYLGGHAYNNTTSSGEINGRRVYLNSIFIPPNPLAWCSTLPVKLLYFQAVPEDESVLLRWATASEINNDHFFLERSFDGIEYLPFQTVLGSGTTSKVSYYSHIDRQPATGKIYYRLTQVDYDGQSETFDPVVVSFKLNKKKYAVYPNPAVDGINILSRADTKLPYSIELIDLCSKTRITTLVKPDQFNKEYFWKFPDGLHPGIYSLKVTDDYSESIFKIIVQDRKP